MHDIIKNGFFMVCANITVMFMGMFRNFYIARVLTPADFGTFNLMISFMTYANYLDLGITSGLLYRASKVYATGDTVLAETYQKQVLSFLVFSILFFFALS